MCIIYMPKIITVCTNNKGAIFYASQCTMQQLLSSIKTQVSK